MTTQPKKSTKVVINKRPWQLLACLQTVVPPSAASVHSCLPELQNPKSSPALKNVANKFVKNMVHFFAQNVSMLQRIFPDNHGFVFVDCMGAQYHFTCRRRNQTRSASNIKIPIRTRCISTYSIFHYKIPKGRYGTRYYKQPMSSRTNFTVPGCVRPSWRRLHPGWRASEGHPPILYTSTAPGINMLQEGDSIQRPLLLSLSVFFALLSEIALG